MIPPACDRPAALPDNLDGIIVDFEQVLPENWLAFVSRCVLEGVPVISADDFVETESGVILLEHLTTARTLVFQKALVYPAVKRVLDFAFVVATVPVWIPVTALAMLFVRLESPGPAIFSQMRVGRRGKPFRIYKIRSMRKDAEKDGHAFAAKADARVTRLGAFLRKTRIDELPQFLNVLKGEMSLIGPRPEQTVLVSQYAESIPFYSFRADLRPGISGWAQVCWKYADNTEDNRVKLEYDFFYLKNFSFWLDLLILAKTVGTVLSGEGSGERRP